MSPPKATKAAQRSKPAAPRPVDGEAQRLMANPVFQALLQEAQQTRSEDLISAEELERRWPLTADERALADAYLTALDQLEAEQGTEVTDRQGHLLELVLVAARFLEGDKPLADWVQYTGFPAAEIHATAVALRAVGRAPTATPPPRAAP